MPTSRSSYFGGFLEDTCDLLLRFRTKRIRIIAGIEEVFVQVGLHYVDRDVNKFLWQKDINEKVTDDNIQIYQFARLPFRTVKTPSWWNKHNSSKTDQRRHIYRSCNHGFKKWWRSFAVLQRSQKSLPKCINESTWLDIQLKACQREHKLRWLVERKSRQGTWTYLEQEYRWILHSDKETWKNWLSKNKTKIYVHFGFNLRSFRHDNTSYP